MPVEPEHRKLAAIMFTDMVGYSALTQRNEALALALLHAQQQVLRPIFAQYSGREVKSTGDGFLVEFASALQAVRCALEIQKGMVQRNSSEPPERRIQVRIGLHLGDIETRDGDVFGDGVNIAARVEPLADAGGICITGAVADQVRNKIDEPLELVRRPEMKNIQAPIDVYRVVLPWTEGAPGGARRKAGAKTWHRPGLAVLIAVLLIAAGVTVWRYRQPAAPAPQVASPSTAPAPPAHAEGRKSVAVLPFANMSGNDADEYLSDGMSEEIITALSKVSGLRVAARTSSFFFKGKNEDIKKIGEQLRVGTVLEGSVRKAGTKLRVTAQLINVEDGYHLWSENYDEDTADILAIESTVAQRVAGALKATLLASEQAHLQKKSTDNPEAHRLYLQGRYYTSRFTAEGMNKGRDYLQQAIAIDPGYALAYLGLAYYYVGVSDYYVAPKDAMPQLRAAAEKALQLDATLAEAHAFLATFHTNYEWDGSAAADEYKQALTLDADCVFAHQGVGGYLVLTGRGSEGLAELRRAAEIDPLSPEANTILGQGLYFLRRYDDAIVELRTIVDRDPTYWWANTFLGRAYVQKGDLERAVPMLRHARELDPRDPESLGALGQAYAVAGDRTAAQKTIEQLRQRSREGYVAAYDFTVIHAALGETDQAFARLQKAYDDRSFYMTWLKVDPQLDPLRSDPRFAELVKKVGLDK